MPMILSTKNVIYIYIPSRLICNNASAINFLNTSHIFADFVLSRPVSIAGSTKNIS